jgi:dTDP-4-dehydrorhamnose 3,5-epimerase
MILTRLNIPDVICFEPEVHDDDRGFFFESYNRRRFSDALGSDLQFVQDNHSRSKKGVLRGIHYQLPPRAQGKLVRVLAGEVFDVAVDLRRGSQTFGRWIGEILSSENKKQLWIPEGFGHGHITLSETADVFYKTTDYYEPSLEGCIKWDDPLLKIDWPYIDDPHVSLRDEHGVLISEAKLFDY